MGYLNHAVTWTDFRRTFDLGTYPAHVASDACLRSTRWATSPARPAPASCLVPGSDADRGGGGSRHRKMVSAALCSAHERIETRHRLLLPRSILESPRGRSDQESLAVF